MLTRASQFRAATQTDTGRFRSAVYLYESRSAKDYGSAPEKLAERIALLGFTSVYMTITSSGGTAPKAATPQALAWRKAFIRAAHARGVLVHQWTLRRPPLFLYDQEVINDCNIVLDYNKSVAPDERFDGVSADLEPHDSDSRPKELTKLWDMPNAVPGGGCDILLKRTLDVLALAKKTIAPLPLLQAVNVIVQNLYDDNKVENGDARQFLKTCDVLIVMAYSDTKEGVWKKAEPILRSAKNKPATVSVCIKTSHSPSRGPNDRTTLQLKGWDNMIDAVKYILSKSAPIPAFRGLDIFEYDGFEHLWTDTVPPPKPQPPPATKK